MADPIWLGFISILTVGYGDIFPQTHLGRLDIILGYFIGQVLLSILIVSLIDIFSLKTKELRAYYNLKIE